MDTSKFLKFYKSDPGVLSKKSSFYLDVNRKKYSFIRKDFDKDFIKEFNPESKLFADSFFQQNDYINTVICEVKKNIRDSNNLITIQFIKQVVIDWIISHKKFNLSLEEIAKKIKCDPPREIAKKFLECISEIHHSFLYSKIFFLPEDELSAQHFIYQTEQLSDLETDLTIYFNIKSLSMQSSILDFYMEAYEKRLKKNTKTIVENIIGEDCFKLFKKVQDGDKIIINIYLNEISKINNPITPFSPSLNGLNLISLPKKELKMLHQQLNNRIYEWLTPDDVNSPPVFDEETRIQMLRCLVTDNAILFNSISVKFPKSPTISISYKKIYKKENERRVLEDIIGVFSLAGWKEVGSSQMTVNNILNQKSSCYFLPLYSCGNVLYSFYNIMRSMLQQPECGIRLVTRPGYFSSHKITWISPTQFKTKSNRHYMLKRDLEDGSWIPKSYHKLVTTVFWDSTTHSIIKGNLKFNTVFDQNVSDSVRFIILQKWYDQSQQQKKKEKSF